MASTDPKFIRLTRNRQRTICADTRSGFSISGKDVQPFPKSKERAKFVRKKIVAMVIEPATQAEYEEIMASNSRTVDMTGDDGHQEHRIYEDVDRAGDEAKKAKKEKKKGKKAAKAAAESNSSPEPDPDVDPEVDPAAVAAAEAAAAEEAAKAEEEAKKVAAAKKAPAKKAAAKKTAGKAKK